MNTKTISAALAAGMVMCSGAQADFQAALGEYRAGHYDSAHQQFLALAELGDCSSQFNLGAMALQGQGGTQDTGSGVGWLEAAASNGCRQLVGNKLTTLSAKLSAEQQDKAAAILARYGHDALQAQGVINPDLNCANLTPPRELSAVRPEYPGGQSGDGLVIAVLTIGRDGHVRDPQILQSLPGEAFAAKAIEAWLNSTYSPALRNGQPVVARVQTHVVFSNTPNSRLADEAVFKQARPAAQSGDAGAEYLVGLSSTADPALGIPSAPGGQLLLASARDGDAQAQYWIGSQLRATAECHPHADGSVWLRHAADGGSPAAQLTLATDLLREGPAQAAQARALLQKAAGSRDYYVRKHVVALLAASPIEQARDPATALSLAKQLGAGDIQSDPQMFEAVAAAYAVNGDYGSAVTAQRHAVQKAEALGWNTAAMRERLSAYRSDKPWQGDLFASD